MAADGLSGAFLRRWYVTLIGICLSLALGAAASLYVPVQHSAQAVVLLVPPRGAAGANPYLNLGSLSGLGDVLAQSMSSAATVEQVRGQGLVTTFTVGDDVQSSGPLVLVTATADTSQLAKRTANYVVGLIPGILRTLQTKAGVYTKNSYITSEVINPVDRTTTVSKNQVRATIAAVAVGLLLTVLCVALAERWGKQPPTRSVLRAKDDSPGAAPLPGRGHGASAGEDVVTAVPPVRGRGAIAIKRARHRPRPLRSSRSSP